METEACPRLRPFNVKGVPDQRFGLDLMEWVDRPEPKGTGSDVWAEIDNLKAVLNAIAERMDTMHEAMVLPKDTVKTLVKGYTMDVPEDEPIYPSDIAYRYNLDPDMVEEVMEELLEEGFFR